MPGEYGKPLITQKTDLKSLKYTTVLDSGHTVGKDPYVTKKIPTYNFEKNNNGLIEAVIDPLPTPKASGILGARVDDLKRLTKAVAAKGLKFSTNQALLGQSPKQIALTIGSTLAQAPVNGSGTHFTHGFVVDTYLKQDIANKTKFGRAIAEILAINNFHAAPSALVGKTIITDNEGQPGYRNHRESDLAKLNSKFDLQAGADNFSSTLLDKLRINPYVDTLARGIESPTGQKVIGKAKDLIQGIFGKKKKEQDKGIPNNLGNIFKLKGDNLGQDGFRPMTPSLLANDEADEIHDTIESNLKGPKNPSNHLTTGADDIEGRPLVKGGQKRIVRENNGGRGFEPQAPDFLSKKESEQTINVNGEEEPLRPKFTLESNSPGYQDPSQLSDFSGKNKDGYNQLDHHAAGTEEATNAANASKHAIGNNPIGPSPSGRIMSQIGPDGIAEGEFRTFVDDEGGVTGVIERQYNPNNPSQLKMYLQDQPGIPESENLKTELGGTVSSGDTNTKRITKLIDFRKVRKWGVNAGVHGKTESIGPDSNGYSSTTPSDILPDYTADNIEVRLKMGQKGAPDYINVSDVINVGNTSAAAVAEDATWQYYNGDIIPFTFNTLTPDGQKFLFFRAFLDDLSDNYSGDWAGTQYIGRAEEFFTYQGFKRDVSFSFKVAAFTKEELLPLYKKLNHLVASTAPTYSKAGNFMRGTLTTLSIGEYLDRQDGFISKVDLSWEKGYPWEIDLFNENLPIVPTILNVSVNFTPIHNFEVKADIDLENKNESYFGAQFGAARKPVERVNTTQPRPATTTTRPQAEIPTIPKPEETKVATPVATPTPNISPKVSNEVNTPTAQSNTVNPTTQNTEVQSGFQEVPGSRKINLTGTIPPKWSVKLEYTNLSNGKKGTGRAVNINREIAVGRARLQAIANAK